MASPKPALAKDLIAVIETGVGAYVLIDPMLGEPLPDIRYRSEADIDSVQRIREQVWRRPTFTVMLDRSVPLLPAQYPYLVGLDGRHDEWLPRTFELARSEREACWADGLMGSGGEALHVGGWLLSSMRETELTDALAKLLRLDTIAYTGARYLRLPDPRVMDWTGRVIGKARLSASLGRIRRWLSVDAIGGLADIEGLGEEAKPLRFTRVEWATMERGEHAHRSVALAVGGAFAEGRQPPDDPYASVLRALDLADHAARRWPRRFDRPRDRQVWAALCLLRGDPSIHHSVCELMNAIPDPEEPPEPVRALASDIADAMSRQQAGLRNESIRHSSEHQQ